MSVPTNPSQRALLASLWLVPAALALALLPQPAVEAALVALGALALAALAVWYPAAGLGLAALAVPFGRLGPLAAAGMAGMAVPIALGMAGIGMGLRAGGVGMRAGSAGRASEGHGMPSGLIAALLAYLAIHAVSAWRAPSLEAAVLESGRWVELALAGGLAAGLAGRRERALVVAALLVAGALACGAGAWLALYGFGPEAFAVGGRGFSRAHWPFGQPNPFGGYANLVWPLGAAVAVVGLERGGPRRLAPIGALAAAVSLIGLGLSWSRGAWLAAAAGGAAMALAWLAHGLCAHRPARLVATWAMATALVAALAFGALRPPAGIAARLASVAAGVPGQAVGTLGLPDVRDAEVTDASFATVERLAHWQAAVDMWAERPWLGQGPGHYALAYPRYRFGQWADPLGHAHNYYLHALAETGILGLAAFGALLALALALGVRSAVAPRSGMEAALGLGLVGALTATAVHSAFDNLWVHELLVHVGLMAGLAIAARRQP